jgi:hypothetical protein
LSQERIAFVRELSWPYVGAQLAVLGACLAIAFLVTREPSSAALWGAGSFLVYSQLSKLIVLRHHRAGIKELRARQFEAAIPHFHRSYAFLAAHPWLDRFRAITFLSASKAPYRELALVNIAYSLVQLDRLSEAKDAYQRVQVEVPDSPHPGAVLKLLDAKPVSK